MNGLIRTGWLLVYTTVKLTCFITFYMSVCLVHFVMVDNETSLPTPLFIENLFQSRYVGSVCTSGVSIIFSVSDCLLGSGIVQTAWYFCLSVN